MFRYVVALSVFLAAMSTLPVRAQDIDVVGLAGTARAQIAAGLDDEGRTKLEAIVAATTTAAGVEGLGMALLLKRHLDESAYLYARALELDPASPTLMTSLGALGQQLKDAGRPIDSLDPPTLVDLQRAALALDPDNAAIKFNLATALLEEGEEASLDEAIMLLEQAFEAEPNNGLFGSRLAEALQRAGREEEAREVLNRAFANDPISIAVLLTNAESFGGGAIKPPAPMCEVNFQCSRICPGGIIGRLNYVNCEIANASAVSSCRAGLPFARSYNCDLQFPAFGILIPGLYPGLSIIFPGGSIDILVQGDGRVDARIHIDGSVGGIGFSFDAEGSYQPSNGDVRIEGSGGIDISLPSSNSPVLDTLKQAGFEPGIQLHFDPAQASGFQFEPSIGDFRGAIVG